MVNARAVLKACISVVTVVSASECADGSCKSETATMLQTKKRGGQLSSNQKTVADLRKSTLKLLKEGGTEEVVKWAETALKEITDDVETAIADSHKVDQELVDDTVGRFTVISNQFAEKVTDLSDLRKQHRDKSSAHLTCREKERLDCDAHTACRAEEDRLKGLKDAAHGRFQSAVNSVKHCDGETTDAEQETYEVQHREYEDYVETGQKFFDAWEAYEEKHRECNGLNSVLDEQTLKCNGLKQDFESASCRSHDHFTLSYEAMSQTWTLQEEQYHSVKTTVGADAADRKTEFETLAEVKCLLAKVQERGGKPCDEEEEAGVTEEIEKHCKEEAKDSSHLDINFPEPPNEPAKPAEEPYPCTSEFISEEYDGLTGPCFDNLPECKACDGSFGIKGGWETENTLAHEG